MTEREERNQKVIDEFRANHGKVGGPFQGRPMVLVTVTGAKTGRRRTVPLVYLREGNRVLVIGSKGGAPTHPDWFHNIVATARVTVEVGDETYEADAKVLERAERDRLYAKLVAEMPFFGDYQTKTSRIIPMIDLERVK